MGKDKLKRFAEMTHFTNVIQPKLEDVKQGHFLKGKWKADFFKNDLPIVIELGCGRGEYTVEMARHYKDHNFIGIDIKGARIWRGAKTCIEDKIDNAAFIRSRIDFLDKLFGANEISEIWLTFSDPQPKRPRKRLTSSLFVDRYRKILAPEGVIHLKTDSDLLFESTLEQIEEHNYQLLLHSHDVYGELMATANEDLRYKLSIQTFYEKKWLGEGIKIKYCEFQIS